MEFESNGNSEKINKLKEFINSQTLFTDAQKAKISELLHESSEMLKKVQEIMDSEKTDPSGAKVLLESLKADIKTILEG